MKKWFNSKTIWFGVLNIVAISSAWMVDWFIAYPTATFVLLLVSFLSNILLRFFTKSKIEPIKIKL